MSIEWNKTISKKGCMKILLLKNNPNNTQRSNSARTKSINDSFIMGLQNLRL